MIVGMLVYLFMFVIVIVYSESDNDDCTKYHRYCANDNEICTRYFGQFNIPDASNFGETTKEVTKEEFKCRSIDFCDWWGVQDGECAKYVTEVKYSYFSDTLFEGVCFGPAIVTVPTNLTVTCCTGDCEEVGWYHEDVWSLCHDVSDDATELLPDAIPAYTRFDDFHEYLACNASQWRAAGCTIPIYEYMTQYSESVCTMTTTLGGDHSYTLLNDISEILVLTLSDQYNWSATCPWWEFSCSEDGVVQQTFYSLVFEISFFDNTTSEQVVVTDELVSEVQSDCVEILDVWALQIDVAADVGNNNVEVTINCFTSNQRDNVTSSVDSALSHLYSITWIDKNGTGVSDVVVPSTTDANGNAATSLRFHCMFLFVLCLVTAVIIV